MGMSVTTFLFITLASKLFSCCVVFFGNVKVGRDGRYMSDVVEGGM